MNKKQKVSAVVIGSGRSSLKLKVLLLTGLVVISIVAFVSVRHYQTLGLCTGKSGSPIYAKAVSTLNKGNKLELNRLSSEVRKQNDFQKDINCLYPLVAVALKNNNIKQARGYYSMMSSAKNSKEQFVDEYKSLGIVDVKSVDLKIDMAEYSNQSPGSGLILY